MEIIISSIADRGELKNERIGFKVLKSCQLKYFIVFKTKKTDNGFTNTSKNAFWFLPNEVNAGDRVVLYTKKGTNSVKKNSNGTLTYFFYWGLNGCLFESDKDTVVLINAHTYKIK